MNSNLISGTQLLFNPGEYSGGSLYNLVVRKVRFRYFSCILYKRKNTLEEGLMAATDEGRQDLSCDIIENL